MPSIDKNKLTKYGLVFASIMVLLKLIPRTELDLKDIVVSSVVLFSLYILIDNIFINPSCKMEKLSGSVVKDIDNHDELNDELNDNVDEPIIKDNKQRETNKYKNSDKKIIDYKPGACTNCVTRTYDEGDFEKYKFKVHRKYEANGSREEDGVMESEIEYTDYNSLPVHKEDKEDFEWGYTILPPEKWFPVPPHPPICVSEKRCDIQSSVTTGGGVLLKEWDSCRRITPGDVINIDYAKDKLNSGR